MADSNTPASHNPVLHNQVPQSKKAYPSLSSFSQNQDAESSAPKQLAPEPTISKQQPSALNAPMQQISDPMIPKPQTSTPLIQKQQPAPIVPANSPYVQKQQSAEPIISKQQSSTPSVPYSTQIQPSPKPIITPAIKPIIAPAISTPAASAQKPSNAQPSWKSSYPNYGSQSGSGASSNPEKRATPFRLYKATKANSGSAFALDLNSEKQSIFIDISKQVGEQKFDWEHKITMKLSITDIGKMLSVLTGSAKSAKLYHDPSKGQYESSKDTRNTVLEFTKGISFGYSLKASEQGTNGSVQSITTPMSEDEAEVVRVLLEASIRKIYGW